MLSELKPETIQKLQVAMNDFGIWESLCDVIKWARLYGGALGILLIDGAKYDKPLNLKAIGKDSFKGILVVDRWMCEPLVSELITDLNKDFGKPKYYRIHTSIGNFPQIKIHYSRVIRFDGITLPYYQKLYENYWGLSVVERIYDRLIAYDSATSGAAQLLYKAYLRTVQIEGLREALALGGKEENAVIKQFTYIRQMQSLEGITLLDSKDQFSTHQYTFSGVSDLLSQFGQQISGATGIPLVRLFGQSPSGFSTGDTDLRNYYDGIERAQENKLKAPLTTLLKIISMSVIGEDLPEDFEFKFNSLWTMTDKDKGEIANQHVTAVGGAFSQGIIGKEIALKELEQLSRVTGIFTNVSKEDIQKAKEEDAAPPPGVEGGLGEEMSGMEGSEEGLEGAGEEPLVGIVAGLEGSEYEGE